MEKQAKLLSVQNAASFLGVSAKTIRLWAQSGKLKGVKVGTRGDWRFTNDDLLTLVSHNRSNHKGADQRRRDAKNPKQAEQRIDILISSIDDHLVTYDTDWCYTFVNEAAAKVLGKPREELLGKCIWDLFPDAINNQYYRELHEASRTKRPAVFEHFYPPFGKWFANHIYPFEGGVTVFATDITARKQAEALYAESEERFRNMADAAPILIGMADEKGNVVYLNKPFLSFLGKSFDEVKTFGYTDSIHPDDLAGVKERYIHTLKNQAPFEMEYRMRRNDGEYRWMLESSAPRFREDGKFIGYVGSLVDITDRNAAKEELIRERKRLSIALRTSELGVYEWSIGDSYVWWSPETFPLYGVDSKTFTPTVEAFSELIHPDDREELWRKTEESISQRKEFMHEYRIVRPDGKVRWIYNHSQVSINHKNKVERITGVVADITERKKTEENLHHVAELNAFRVKLGDTLRPLSNPLAIQEAAMRLLGEQLKVSRVYYVEVEPDEQYVICPKDWTNGVPSVVGRYKLSDFGPTLLKEYRAGRTVVINNTADSPLVPKAMQEAWESIGIRAQLAVPLVKQGRFLAALGVDQSQPRVWSANDTEYVQETAERTWDAVERARFEEALRDSQDRQNIMLQATKVGLWYCDLPFDELIWDDKVKEHFWLPHKARVTIENFYEQIHPEDRERTREAIDFSIKNHTMYDVEFRTVNNKNGQVKWIRSIGRTFYDKKNNPIRFDGVTIEITDRKEMEQQKDAFIGLASHELKTPVTSLKAYTQVLQTSFQRKGDVKSVEQLAKMDSQINKLTSLIEDLLDVTKVQAGKLQFNESYFDFNELVKEIIEEMQRTTKRHKIVQKLARSKTLYGDRDRIGQVLTNLLSNAIKYSPEADKIIVASKVTQKEVTLSVQDFGVGIPNEKKEKIFDRFVRVSSQETIPGIGLGLYISREIIKRQNGKIWVESEEGGGSTFYFSLPIATKANGTL